MTKSNDVNGILLVESDLAVRHPLAEYLRECGFHVVEAASTDEALALLAQQNVARRVDVVLCDVTGPGKIDGFALAHWLREHLPSARIILAGSLTRVAENAGDLCEHGPLLSKPYHHDLLLDRIKREIAHRDTIKGQP